MRMVLSVDLPQEAATVPVVRRVLDCALVEMGVTRDVREDLGLAVTEACSNVLRHAADGGAYTVVGRVDDDRCVLEVRDHGAGYQPGPHARDAVPETSEGGRGLQIMEALVDQVEYLPPVSGDGTRLLLSKRLDGKDTGAATG